MRVYITIMVLRVINFATSKNLVVKRGLTTLPHRSTHNYTWISPDGKTCNQIDHALIARRWHSSFHNVRSVGGADCSTDHYQIIAKLRERLSARKQAAQKYGCETLPLMLREKCKLRVFEQTVLKENIRA
jgi:hypothetical protein